MTSIAVSATADTANAVLSAGGPQLGCLTDPELNQIAMMTDRRRKSRRQCP
jgi:hypothetical protein